MQLSQSGTVLVRVTNKDIQEGVFNIPDGVTSISKNAFLVVQA